MKNELWILMPEITMRMAPGVNQNRRFVAVKHFSPVRDARKRHPQKNSMADCHPADMRARKVQSGRSRALEIDFKKGLGDQ
jgi:hypothetical protein